MCRSRPPPCWRPTRRSTCRLDRRGARHRRVRARASRQRRDQRPRGRRDRRNGLRRRRRCHAGRVRRVGGRVRRDPVRRRRPPPPDEGRPAPADRQRRIVDDRWPQLPRASGQRTTPTSPTSAATWRWARCCTCSRRTEPDGAASGPISNTPPSRPQKAPRSRVDPSRAPPSQGRQLDRPSETNHRA